MSGDNFFNVFLEESRENLQQMEEALLDLEKTPGDSELINTIFRCIHTVKGGAGLMGLEQMSSLAHQLENVLDNTRQSGGSIPQELLNLCFSGMDLLKQILESEDSSGREFQEQVNKILEALESQGKSTAPGSSTDSISIGELLLGFHEKLLEQAATTDRLLYRVHVTLSPGCLLKSVRAYMSLKAAGELGEIIETKPSAEELEEESFEQEYVFLIAGSTNAEELQKAVEGISEIEKVEVSEVNLEEAAAMFKKEEKTGQEDTKVTATPTAHGTRYYRIELKFRNDIFKEGLDPLMFLVELTENGRLLESYVNISGLPALENLDLSSFYLSWTVFLETTLSQTEVEDLFMFVRNDNHIVVEDISGELDFWFNDDKKTGELLVERGLVSPGDLDKVLQKQRRIGELLEEEGIISGPQVEKIVQAQQNQREQEKTDTIRVDTHKLEEILNGVAELLIAQSRIKEISFRLAEGSRSLVAEIDNAFQETDKIIRRLQEDVMNASMVPVGNTFVRFQRMVRDMAGDRGKEVELLINGRETELDKKVIEQIADPLKHILRNALDHGLETPAERKAKGKPPAGKISLNAFHQEGNIVIEIADDGRGIDEKAVFEKAQEKGLVNADSNLSASEIKNLLFAPGFSTAQEVTDISGRGVGLDVVMNNIKNLRGDIELFSEKDQGTTLRIKLPLTLAIIDGMMVRVGQERFIIPLNVITEFIKAEPGDLRKAEGKGLVLQLRKEYLPLSALYQLLGLEPEHAEPTEGILVILQEGSKKKALLVDEIIGQEQVVIKSIKEHMKHVEGIAGATILGDGRVALILDTPSLFQLARRKKIS